MKGGGLGLNSYWHSFQTFTTDYFIGRRKALEASNSSTQERSEPNLQQSCDQTIARVGSQSNDTLTSTRPPTFLDLLTFDDQRYFHHILHTIDDTKPDKIQPIIPPLLPYLNTTTYHLPLPLILFPLAPDHRLLTLIRK